MFLARIIRATNTTHYSIIRITWVTKVFVGGDILCFLMQAAGGGILASSDDKAGTDIGEGVILAGLCLQMVIFGFFMVVAAVWQKRMKRAMESGHSSFTWLKYLNMLYIVNILITLRNLFRVIEYGMGSDAYLLANEWPIYVFDAALMVAVLAICAAWYIADAMKAAQNEGNYMHMLGRSDQLVHG